MPFGYTYLAGPQLFFFDGLDPDRGLTHAIESLGWTCRVERGGDEQTALARLRMALQHGLALLGPLNMGYLTYQPNYRLLGGFDHYLVVLAVEENHVVVHDPKGFPMPRCRSTRCYWPGVPNALDMSPMATSSALTSVQSKWSIGRR